MAPVIDVSLVFEVRCLVHGGWGWGGGCSECRHCNAFQAFWPDELFKIEVFEIVF
jgi:hypothetical protein